MNHIDVMKQALDEATNVCWYLDSNMIEEAKAHTKFYWEELEKIGDREEAERDEKFCDNNCTWLEHHPNCIRYKPPQREWVGLSAHEMSEIYQYNKLPYEILKATEAKLKEKNT